MAKELEHLTDFFDSRASICNNSCYVNGYSAQLNESADFYDQVIAELNQLLFFSKNTILLEIGCGTGEILARLNKLVQQTQGIDISEKMVTLAKTRGLDVTHYRGKQLPFANASFDVIILYQVVTNLPSLHAARQLILEAIRVLKNQGKLFIGAVPDPIRSNFPQHSYFNLRSIFSWLRSRYGLGNTIGCFSYNPAFFLEFYRELNMNVTFVRCTLQRSGWETKYHIIMEKS